MKAKLLIAAVNLLTLSFALNDSSCLKIKEIDECSNAKDDSTGEACVWCTCSAIPSECVPSSMAKKLPPAIFNCNAPIDVPQLFSPVFKPSTIDEKKLEPIKQPEVMFEHWKQIYSKQYDSFSEENKRFEIFRETVINVVLHNVMNNRPYKLGLNRFSDLTWEEFSENWLGARSSQNCSATHVNDPFAPHKSTEVPDSIDWREFGAVSPVKDQGRCGSCWTFSTTGCLESHHFLSTGNMVLLSEQQLVDCAQDFDNHGCNGGLPSHAFEYIHQSGGLDTESAYPYTAHESKCMFAKEAVGATVIRSVNITFQDEYELEQAVGSVGPVAVAFEVMDDFKSYASGVYDNPDCSTSPDKVNHAVLAVGYSSDEEFGDYWIIKNSWGESWGESGYFKMSRGTNMCGVADCASYPLV